MSTALVALTLVVALILLATGGAKVVAVPDMRSRADHLGFSVAGFRLLGLLELAGVAGLLLGWLWPGLGLAAALALTAMMIGAVVCHLRVSDPLRDAAPALVVATLLVAVATLRIVTG